MRMSRLKLGMAMMTMVLGVAIGACGSLPSIATDVTYCCEPGTEGIHTFRVEFEDMPEFLKPMLRDEASIVLSAKGVEYTEGDAHAILLMSFVNTPLTREEAEQYEAWGTISPGGDAHFIAEVKLEMKNSVTGEMIWAGSMGRVHNVAEGSYMHDAPARAAMRSAFLEIFADYPNPMLSEP